MANSLIFVGDWGPRPSMEDHDTKKVESRHISLGNLHGRKVKLKSPESYELDGKCVLVFGPGNFSVGSRVEYGYYRPFFMSFE